MSSLSLGLLLELSVGLDTAYELLSRPGQRNVLDSEVDALLDVAVLDFLIDDHADCALRNVVDDTSLSVVNLVWHTVMNQHLFPFSISPAFVVSSVCFKSFVRTLELTPSEQHRLP